MPRKRSKYESLHPSSLRKRNSPGNRYSLEAETEATSSAAKKLNSTDDDFIVSQTHGYRFIEIFTVFSALSQMLICKECKESISLGETGNRGLGFKIAVTCSCGVRKISSSPSVNNAFEINRRITFVMRLLGICKEGIDLFCGLMDICQGLNNTTYYAAVKNMHTSTSAVFHMLSRKAVEEEKELNSRKEKPSLNFVVSGDGTWKAYGFSSLFGVTTLTGQNTGKIIDLVVRSSHCQSCHFWRNKEGTPEYFEWFEGHEETCAVNRSGSAGKIKVDSTKEMFSRSEEQFGVKYTDYIGDLETLEALLDLQPYGEHATLKKSECVECAKRMGARLRNVQAAAKLGGEGELTDALVRKLTKYYGLAMGRHPDSASEMKRAIMAIYHHACSTDENPQHQYCPSGAESWCKWQVARVTGRLDEFEHQPAVSKEVQDHLLPIYEDLARDDLLERCARNATESFNATVWRLAPKHLPCDSQTIEIAARLAAAIFNEGYYPVLKIMETMGIVIGQQCKIFVDSYNEKRLLRAEHRSSERPREARAARKMKGTIQQDLEEEEGIAYGPGMAD
nr:PREDICTED: uncharacterized protein LOC105670133 [Linepithema humile]